MLETNRTTNIINDLVNADQWPGINSHFLLIAVAARRHKQLAHGATPRVAAAARRSRNTSIALEEVRQGLVAFTHTQKAKKDVGDNHEQWG